MSPLAAFIFILVAGRIESSAALATGAISGKVTNSTAAGIANVFVRVYTISNPSSYYESATTDSSGNYTVQNLPSGSYKVKFSASFSDNYPEEWYNKKSSYAEADSVSVTEGTSTSGINAQLTTGGIISGKVTDTSGAGINYVSAYIYTIANSSSYFTSAMTNSSGNFSVSKLPAGSYKVYFSPSEDYLAEWYNDKPSYAAANPIAVTAGGTTSGVNAQLTKKGIISGKVTNSSGAGIADVFVSVYSLTDSNSHVSYGYTDSSGNYEVQGLLGGSYKLHFRSYDEYLAEWYNDKPSYAAADAVAVTVDSTTSGINAQLATGGIISGKVTNSSGAGIAHVYVNIYALSGATSFIDSAITDSSGNYLLQKLAAGSYKVYFDPDAYDPYDSVRDLHTQKAASLSGAGNYFGEWYNDKPDYVTADPVAVTVGSTTSGIDAQLATGGSISGKVLNSSGAGISGVSILVYASTNSSSSYSSTTTDSSGNYSIQKLISGSYKVYFSSTGNYFPEWYNDKYSFGSADLVTVTVGSTTTGINAQLTTGGSISGKVTDSSAAGISDVPVEVYALSNSSYSFKSATTDSLGNYTLKGLPSGSFKIFMNPTGNFLPEWYNDKPSFGAANAVAVTAGNTTSGINAQLALGGSIYGKITNSSGAGIINVLAQVYTLPNFLVTESKTDSSGNYTIQRLPSGSYKIYFNTAPVTFDGPGAGNYLSEWYNDEPSFGTANPVTVTAGNTTSGINAQLTTGGSISGKVTDSSGAGISGVPIDVYTLSNSSSSFRSATTDSSGNYTVRGLPSGSYKVCFSSDGNHLGKWYNDKSNFDPANPVTVTAGSATSGINAQLESGGCISGKVTDPFGAGIHYVSVLVYVLSDSSSSFNSAITDSSGNYTVEGLPSGSYKVNFTTYNETFLGEWYNDKPSFGTANAVAVTAGNTTSGINAQLALGGSITGIVTDFAGAGINAFYVGNGIRFVSVRVYTLNSSYSYYKYSTTDSSGKYEVSGLPSGSYKVNFSPFGSYVAEWYNDKVDFVTADRVAVTAGNTTSGINAQLAIGGSISGRVTDSAGTGISDVAVRVFKPSSSSSYFKSGITDLWGNYEVQGLPSGSYKVYFYNTGDYVSEWYNDKSSFDSADSVAVTAGNTTSGINAQLAIGGSLSGKVIDSSGTGIKNVAGQIYTLSNSSSFIKSAATDLWGKYEVLGLPAGSYKVQFRTGGNYIEEWFNDKSDFDMADPVAVIAGSATSGIDAQLAMGGSISGKVTDSTAAGVNALNAGNGIGQVSVRVYTLDKSSSYYKSSTTDSSGDYEIRGLPSGSYKVYFYNTSDYVSEWYNDKPSYSAADPVAVITGSLASGIDAQLAMGGSISGKITDSASADANALNAGNGISQVSVRVYTLDNSSSYYKSSTTDSSGDYEIRGLPSGSYNVYFYNSGDYVSEWYNDNPSFGAADPVAVTAGSATSGIDAQLAMGGSISGKVTDSSGAGIGSIFVDIYPLGDSASPYIFDMTDAWGNYEVLGLPGGSYKVRFSSSANYLTEWYNDKPDFDTADLVAVTAGSATSGINAQLATKTMLGSISGRVTNSFGTGIANVSIRIFTPSDSSTPYKSANTVPSGNYTVSDLPSGSYKVNFNPSGNYVGEWFNDKADFAAADSVAVTAGQTTTNIDAVLAPLATGQIRLSRSSLHFGAQAGGNKTADQSFLISCLNAAGLNWSITSSAAWLACAPTSGQGNTQVAVSVNHGGLEAGTYSGTLTVASPNATNSPQTVTVNLRVYAAGESAPPFGDFATPTDGTTGITGAIPVTGWVLDDIETTKVEIWRDPVAGEGISLVFIGIGIFVEGARPDVEIDYPNYPLNFRAGWGYMLLTNFLPNQGNGTYKLYSYAEDKEGNRILLGTKTITCDNAHATKPFGTIDTPIQGGDASGNPFLNFGWVLTPMPKTVPKDGSTILVYVDAVHVGDLKTAPNVYDQYRVDVATSFPGLNNSSGPVGAFFLDTTKYANGVHTIYWIATDDQGAADGIGSRYFNIMNTGASGLVEAGVQGIALGLPQSFEYAAEILFAIESLAELPVSFNPVWVKRGFNRERPAEMITPDNYGLSQIEIEEVVPLEIDLADSLNKNPSSWTARANEARYRGYQLVGTELRPLPIGSTLDSAKGTFSWMPGPGFVGEYKLVFIVKDNPGSERRILLNVRIVPKR